MALNEAKEYVVKAYTAALLPLEKKASGEGDNMVYQGAFVCSSSESGGLRACDDQNTSDLFVGIATESVKAQESDLDACQSDLIEEKVVLRRGEIFNAKTAAGLEGTAIVTKSTQIGTALYIVDDETLCLLGTAEESNLILAGYLERYISDDEIYFKAI